MTNNTEQATLLIVNAHLLREVGLILNSLASGYTAQGGTVDARRLLNALELPDNVKPYVDLQQEVDELKHDINQYMMAATAEANEVDRLNNRIKDLEQELYNLTCPEDVESLEAFDALRACDKEYPLNEGLIPIPGETDHYLEVGPDGIIMGEEDEYVSPEEGD